MIPEKLKALFQFIEFLHSKIDYFKQFDSVYEELILLKKKLQTSEVNKITSRKLLCSDSYYQTKGKNATIHDIKKYYETQQKINKIEIVIWENFTNIIQNEAIDLKIYTKEWPVFSINFYYNEIDDLQKNCTDKDIAEIVIYHEKYIELKNKINQQIEPNLFSELDHLLKDFFPKYNPPKLETIVLEYSDWMKGNFLENLLNERVVNLEENKIKYYTCTDEVLKKIKKNQKEIYLEKVELFAQKYIENFNDAINKSGNKERLLESEIDRYEKLLFEEKLKFTPFTAQNEMGVHKGFPNYNLAYINHIREAYTKTIVRGEKDYSKTDYIDLRNNKDSNQQSFLNRDRYFIEAEAINNFLNYLNSSKIVNEESKPKIKKIEANWLGLFCNLINQIGIYERSEDESLTKYCTRICLQYNLPYTTRVRLSFNVIQTTKIKKNFSEHVLPLIDSNTKALIQKILEGKPPPKQNIYS